MENTKIVLSLMGIVAVLGAASFALNKLWIWICGGPSLWALAGMVGTLAIGSLFAAIVADLIKPQGEGDREG